MYNIIVGECIEFIKTNAKDFHNHEINSIKIVNKNVADCFLNGESNDLFKIIYEQRLYFTNINELYNLQDRIDDFNRDMKEQNCSFYYRIKSGESLNDKIIRNMNNSLYGKVKLQKIINDLIGFRITINTNIEIEEIFESIKKTYEDSTIKVLDSSKKGYKAVHLYIKDPTGINLPIELQIWRTKDFMQNQQCHAIYKQKQWEKK